MGLSPQRARTVANVLLLTAGSVAAYFILSRPRARRAVWTLSRPYLARLPGYLRHEVSQAWMQTGRTS